MDTDQLKKALEQKLIELTERARDIEEDLSAKPDSDWEENAIDSEDDEVLASLGDLTQHDIQDIRLALSRIASGKYGTCVSCNHPIGEDRLEALPHATRCIKCA